MAIIQPVNNTLGNGMKSHFMFCQFLESHVYLRNLGSLGWGYNMPSPKHCSTAHFTELVQVPTVHNFVQNFEAGVAESLSQPCLCIIVTEDRKFYRTCSHALKAVHGFIIGQTATTVSHAKKNTLRYRPSTKEDESSRGIILVVSEEQDWPNLEKGSGHDNQIGQNAITKSLYTAAGSLYQPTTHSGELCH
ncbi:hypothetical protein C8R44DRAFT_733232 [Mycena epipterygia]|nr:hypothetical protein C8R44DRAFT_733232 [Mycena epipterygia]